MFGSAFVFMFVFGVRVRCLCSVFVFMFAVQFYENLQITPLGNVRLFRIIRKNDVRFLKMYVFSEHLVNLCVFSWTLVNYVENIQIIPLGNVRLFRRIRKNDGPFLKTCVFLAEVNIFRLNR